MLSQFVVVEPGACPGLAGNVGTYLKSIGGHRPPANKSRLKNHPDSDNAKVFFLVRLAQGLAGGLPAGSLNLGPSVGASGEAKY